MRVRPVRDLALREVDDALAEERSPWKRLFEVVLGVRRQKEDARRRRGRVAHFPTIPGGRSGRQPPLGPTRCSSTAPSRPISRAVGRPSPRLGLRLGTRSPHCCRSRSRRGRVRLPRRHFGPTVEPLERFPEIEAHLSPDPVQLPFEDGGFDTVLSCGVLEHVHDPDTSLDEIRRVLAPGGTFVTNLPNRYSYTERIARLLGLYYHGRLPNDQVYTRRTATAARAARVPDRGAPARPCFPSRSVALLGRSGRRAGRSSAFPASTRWRRASNWSPSQVASRGTAAGARRSRSASTIISTSSRNVWRGSQPRSLFAFAGSPTSWSTSAGRAGTPGRS